MATTKKISSANALTSVPSASTVLVSDANGAVSAIPYSQLLTQLKSDLAGLLTEPRLLCYRSYSDAPNADNLKDAGFIYAGGASKAKGYPADTAGVVVNMPSVYSRFCQLFFPYGGGAMYYRSGGFSSGWGEWQQVNTTPVSGGGKDLSFNDLCGIMPAFRERRAAA